MSVPPEWLSFHQGVATEWTPTSHNEAWGTYGEATAAFQRYTVQAGWYLLEGPSGRGGHAWNAPGPDIMAYRATGPLALEIVDNKAVASLKNISDASALRQNLLDGMRQRATRYAGRQFDDVPRIGEIRELLNATVRALEIDSRTLPPGVRLVVTNAAGAPQNVTRGLRRQGIEFESLTPPALQGAVRNRIPPELYEVRDLAAPTAPRGTRFSPAMRAAAVVTLIAMASGPVLNRIRDWAERGRAEEKLKALEPRIREHIEANPDDGVLLTYVYRQLRDIPPDSLIGPVPVFHTVWVDYGRTYPEAFATSQRSGHLEGPPRGMQFVYRDVWIPPPLPPSDADDFSDAERGLQPEERGTLPSERGLGDAPKK